MKITTKILASGSVQAKSDDGWTLTVSPKVEQMPWQDSEEWVARRLARAVWPLGSFSLICINVTRTTTEWYANQ
jgi:hypothetical protein